MPKFTGYQIFDLLSGLRGLDGEESKQEVPTPRTIFKFSGTTVYSLAKNLSRVTRAAALLEKTKNNLVRQYGLDKTSKPGEEATRNDDMNAFKSEWEKVLSEEVELVVTRIKVSELKLEENRIPIQVLANLESILEDSEAK